MTNLITRAYDHENDFKKAKKLKLRDADYKTLKALSKQGVKGTIAYNIKHSTIVFTLCDKVRTDDVYGICGLRVVHDGDVAVGSPWMFAEERISEDTSGFFKGSHEIIKCFSALCDWQGNFVWSGHDYSIRWLKKLGFVFDPENTTTIGGLEFAFYTLDSKEVK